jgi:hypothetical protein
VQNRPELARAPSSRGAFTLFETLVALGVSVVLSAALYFAVDLYARLTSAGKDDSERAQIARAALRQIELDLHAVVYVSPNASAATSAVPKPQSGSGGGSGSGGAGGGGGGSGGGGSGGGGSGGGSGGSGSGGGSGGGGGGGSASGGGSSGSGSSSSGGSSSNSSSSNSNTNTQATTVVPPATGVFGDNMHVMLTANRPMYPSLGTSLSGAQALAPPTMPNDARAIQYNVGMPPAGTAGLISTTGGLLRTRAPALSLDSAITSGTLEGLGATEMLAPEIIAIQFQYFDGTTWQTSWDSTSMGALPRAVEVTVQVVTTAELRRQAIGTTPVGEVYRLVVPMVLSTPIDLQEVESQ